jgi:hypothetical protein
MCLLTPVIQGIQEVETERFRPVQGKDDQTPSQPINWMAWCTPLIPVTQEVLVGGWWSEASPR